MRFVLALLVLAALVLVAARPAAASRLDEAEAAVQAELDRLGVDRSRIKSIFLAADDHPRAGPVPSYTGWIAFVDCRGNLVIDLSQTAAVRTIYTTGDCKVPGVE